MGFTPWDGDREAEHVEWLLGTHYEYRVNIVPSRTSVDAVVCRRKTRTGWLGPWKWVHARRVDVGALHGEIEALEAASAVLREWADIQRR